MSTYILTKETKVYDNYGNIERVRNTELSEMDNGNFDLTHITRNGEGVVLDSYTTEYESRSYAIEMFEEIQ